MTLFNTGDSTPEGRVECAVRLDGTSETASFRRESTILTAADPHTHSKHAVLTFSRRPFVQSYSPSRGAGQEPANPRVIPPVAHISDIHQPPKLATRAFTTPAAGRTQFRRGAE